MCQRTGANISLKGRGSTKSTASSDEDLHVLIEGTQECVTKAEHEVDEILYNPERAARIKSEQLQNLAKQRSSENASSSSSAYSPPSSPSAPWSSGEAYRGYGPPGGGYGYDSGYGSYDSYYDNSSYYGSGGGRGGYGRAPPPSYGQSRPQPPSYSYSSNSDEDYMECPNYIIGSVIGKGGEIMRNLQLQAGGNLHVEKDNDTSSSKMRLITIKGTPEQRAELRRRIDEIITTGTFSTYYSNQNTCFKVSLFLVICTHYDDSGCPKSEESICIKPSFRHKSSRS